MEYPSIEDLWNLLPEDAQIIVQTHDFPDHDAMASANGLLYLIQKAGFRNSVIVYGGDLERSSIQTMVKRFYIEAEPLQEFVPEEKAVRIVIDSRPGNTNVQDMNVPLVGIIDHHTMEIISEAQFMDIRPDYGSCASIIADYYFAERISPPPEIATPLILGILMDTLQLTRSVHQKDIEAYYNLYHDADMEFVNSMVRNNIQLSDLVYFKAMMEKLHYRGSAAYMHFDSGCPQSLLGILANFLLSVEEINTSLLSARNKQGIQFSMRSEDQNLKANEVLDMLLENSGFSGGHEDMAGGIILDPELFSEDKCRDDFFELCVKSEQVDD
jgi:nanoRNase/pAp phosphatase (c-di-AMP/oligoRNAs hydrolase)